MARTAKHSRGELREMALDAAERILVEDGVENLTVRRVAERIGCSVGTLYNNFANVEDLILSLDARTLDILHDELAAAPRSGDPGEDLQQALTSYLRFIERHADRWNLLFKVRAAGGGEPPDWYLERIDRLFARLGDILAPLFAPGQEEERGRAVRLLWLALHGVWSLHAGGQLGNVTREPMEDVARGMAEIFLAGIRARSRQPGTPITTQGT